MPEFITIAEENQVPADRGLSVRVGDREFALFRLDGEYYALDGRCPHRGGPLGEGLVENGRVFCPLHGWEFDVKTGAHIGGNSEKPVACFPINVAGGKIQIQI
jgi:NAD(P)H-dependent nitrite reductase small subunit